MHKADSYAILTGVSRVVELGGVVHQVGLNELEGGQRACDGQASDQVDRWLSGPVRFDLYIGPVVSGNCAVPSADKIRQVRESRAEVYFRNKL